MISITMKRLFLMFLCGLLCFFMRCSAPKQFGGFVKFWQPRNATYTLSDEDIARFGSQMRPSLGNGESHYQLASYYQERSRHEEAIEELKKAIFIKPDYAEAYNAIGISYDWLGDGSNAIKAYQTALRLHPDLDYVHNNLGHSYLLQGDYSSAIESFKKALTLNERNTRIHNNLGLAYALSGQYDLAMTHFETAGGPVRAHYNMATVLYEKGMVDEAKKHYAQTLALDPSFTPSRKGLLACDTVAKIYRAGMKIMHQMEVDAAAPPDAVSEGKRAPVSRVGIEISNGNGIANMARAVGGYLREKGFNVVRFTNADNFNYRDTSLYYRKDAADAVRQIAGEIPEIKNTKEVAKLDRPNIQVKMLLGKDLVPHRKTYSGGKKP